MFRFRGSGLAVEGHLGLHTGLGSRAKSSKVVLGVL